MSAGQDGAPVHPPRRHQRGTLFQRKNGLWIGKVRDPRSVRTGMRRMLSVSSVDAATAAEKLDRLIDDLDAEYAAAGGYSTGSWLRLWADEIHAVKVRPSTIRKYLSVIDNHIVPAIGDVPLRRLAPHHLRRMLAAVPTSRNALTCDTVATRVTRGQHPREAHPDLLPSDVTGRQKRA
ncbi:tyrosine-type recombinase/integrase [Mycolicibacter minnesotensis]